MSWLLNHAPEQVIQPASNTVLGVPLLKTLPQYLHADFDVGPWHAPLEFHYDVASSIGADALISHMQPVRLEGRVRQPWKLQ
jgi:hypothetical protein